MLRLRFFCLILDINTFFDYLVGNYILFFIIFCSVESQKSQACHRLNTEELLAYLEVQ